MSRIFHPRTAVVIHDLFMVWVAWTGMLYLRYSFVPYLYETPLFNLDVVLVLLAQGAVFWWTGLYRGLWRFASMPDMVNIARACVGGALLVSAVLFVFIRLEGIPRSGLFIYPVLLAVLLATPRLLYRFWKDWRLSSRVLGHRRRVLILGAGRAGEMLARDMRREGVYDLAGFLDDDRKLAGSRLHGMPVLGRLEDIACVAADTSADLLVLAMPSATDTQMQRIVGLCEQSRIAFRTLPRLQDMLTGQATFNQLREVAIEDLLGRETVNLDWQGISAELTGRRVLVTGGGGSIGGELCRQVARLDPVCLGILENSEHNLYQIERELRREFPDLVLEAVLGDACDHAMVEHTLARLRPEVIFHAAAYKHVPLLQGQLREAVRNNVLGTEIMARAADRHDVGIFLFISTDKAVKPANVMGATKRIAEQFCQEFAAYSNTHFITVRFGNVLDSAGSVLPLFREQIRAGGPLTVTHPDMRRYFMTIPEACQLILQAAALGEGGEIFVLDMGEPVEVKYLAEQMIRLADRVHGKDIEIVYTGLRAGEKLAEELFYEEEGHKVTAHEKILLARHKNVDWNRLQNQFKQLSQAVKGFDEISAARLLAELLPGFGERADDSTVVPMLRNTGRKEAGT